MGRAFLIVLDSVGCGAAEDAAAYGDEGANTLLHIAQGCADGRGDRPGLRAGPLRLPVMGGLGLSLAVAASCGEAMPGLPSPDRARGMWGYGVETSSGKDTPSGHWEIAGAPVASGWGYFPDTRPSFPPDLTAALIAEAGLPGILGDRHASGTAILDELGEEHIRTGKPICYSSVDSVLQIAAHEESFGLERLYDVCRVARRLCDRLRIGRVIARPFLGDAASGFVRTPRRKDFAMPPPEGNVLDRAASAGRDVVTLGKIGDIFAHRSTGREVKAPGNMALFDALLAETASLRDGGFLFANFVDFDTEFGHRRDVPGYAAALEAFDARLPAFVAALRPGDIAIVTADHGNDPTFRGTDHTREHTPILAFGPGLPGGSIGRRETLADIAETVAAHLALPSSGPGRSWLAGR
ncbi:phosphopentomutase [Alsobacter sp. SYSU M60028]|uniref:Phosphopentomutase n=1 Tax=Alsobacter ponti TaxID=2962936 RepID=A0ABT1L9F4_9HYPH|nr:phosphopentomutase [Alsobacter ponti]MCP8938122.1 phosphopentomutase [Alsobacter ponti]